MKVRENCIVTKALESIVFFWFGFACYLEYQPTKMQTAVASKVMRVLPLCG
ncbi:unnamed protein product [Prunus armeniaca]|uniref:Uncharacterized protein n=1 Tax=Prunus armeniaca TaxID=36596 RepID=A0A6J5WJY8_PRUAR|nr:unnamed protein product [Prunus armeniaca]CAB4302076.1 unnamed protein product [Prunus armeniaca]